MNNDLKLNMKIISNNSIDMKAESSENVNVDMKVGSKETDPIFRESPAYTITYQDINEWNNKSDFSGNYNDLLNKPIIPNKTSELTNDSGFINRFVSNLTNYSLTSSFSNVAFSGDYNDLINKPIAPTGAIWGNIAGTLSNQTDLQNALNDKQNLIDSNNKLSSDLIDDTDSLNKFVTSSDITTWNNKSDFSGNYNDLTNKPTIPTLDSTVSTSSTNGVENQAITNYVNNKLSYYSTEELVGKWYDGKNLYKLTVEDTLGNTNGSWKEIQVFTANYVKYITKMEGIFIPSNGNFYAFPFFRGTDSSYANREYVLSNLNPFNGKMSIIAYHNSGYANVYAGKPFYITFYYTKASDYS